VARAWDAVVVGAGPAGAATALRLAAAGRSVVVVERSRFDRPRVGETLAPAVQPLLRGLGVWDRFRALDPLPSWGTRSAWGEPAPAERSHLTNAYGCGWHVDRCAVDRMLADAAADAGAELRTGTTATGWRYDGSGWDVACADGAVLRGRVLVDATGRRAGAGRALGARRVVFDRLVAVAARARRTATDGGYLLVEAVADGWWYTAPVPGGDLVAMLMTDPDLCRRGGWATPEGWAARLGAAPATTARVGGAAASAPGVHPAASHRLLRPGDPRPWLAVGDAGLAVDPISGSGFLRALRTADSAATAVADLLDHPGDAARLLADHESARDRECTGYLTERARYYGVERRFRTPFWARRALAVA
jgi:flavin-dependent dehydrogenase